MNPPTIDDLIRTAQQHHQAKGLPEAEAGFLQAYKLQPNHPRLAFFLGVICHQTNRFTDSQTWLSKAIAIDPKFAEPHFLLGLIHQSRRELDLAAIAYRKALAIQPAHPKCLNNLGRLLLDQRQVEAGVKMLREAVTAAPANPGAHLNLGDGLQMLGQTNAAIAAYKKAIEIQPNLVEAHSNLGCVLSANGQPGEAILRFEKALAIQPKYAVAHYNLAKVFHEQNRLDEAIHHGRQAVLFRPDYGDAFNLLGNLLGLTGNMPEAIIAQRQAAELKPTDSGTGSNVLLSLHYLPEYEPEQIFKEHLKWAATHATNRRMPFEPATRPASSRIRVGYVSPNFNNHSVAYFFEPVLAEHDREAVEIFCYADVIRRDAVTERIMQKAEHWREITGKTDASVAEQICEDRIDILIDLAGHTAHNRMIVFAMKPARVQMTWLGYPDTTGLATMDYRITDAIADPPGISEHLHTEKLLRIEGGCWAYAPPADAPPVAPLPALRNGFVTFGSFNNLPKVTTETLQTWAAILKAVPRSRLLIKAIGLVSRLACDLVRTQFVAAGIDADRIDLRLWTTTTVSHLDTYQQVDIALDPFPYNGTTTTFEALWMGVPVITLAGISHVSRVGTSIAHHSHLKNYVSRDRSDYIKKATELTRDLRRLSQVRLQLRDQVAASKICDAVRVTRQIEAAFTTSIA